MPKNRYKNIVLSFSVIVSISSSLYAIDCSKSDESYFESNKKGWFWGESCDKPKKKKDEEKPKEKQQKVDDSNKTTPVTEEVKPTPEKQPEKKYKLSPKEVNIPWDIINELTRDEVKKIEKEARDIAVTYPTYENVLEHKKLQKHISDGAKAFMNQTLNVTKQDFDMSQWVSSMPVRSAIAINTNNEINVKKRKSIFAKYRNNMILMVVTAKGCDFCEKQKPQLKNFEKEYGVQYELYDMAQFRDFAYSMKVERTPDIFLLFREHEADKSPKIVRIATGFHGVLDLADATVFGLKALKKISDKDVE